MKVRQSSLTLVLLLLALPGQFATSARAATTINPADPYAYGANIGWLNWTADTNNGAVIGSNFCSGYVYCANVGWLNLGSGAPANGRQYQNLSPGDYGVNRDSAGNLRGYAYGANVGWINFEGTGAPVMNLTNGVLSGCAWGANIGWISLSNAVAYVQNSVSVPPVPAPAGLVAWWPGNGNAVDVVGGNNGTLTNGVAYAAGEVGEAFNFGANSAEVLLANRTTLQLQNFTIEAWLQRGSLSNVTSDGQAIAGNALLFGYGHLGYALGISPNGNPLLTRVDNSDVVCSVNVADRNWHHVAVTTTGGTVVFYMDGVAYPVAGSYNPGYTFTTTPAIGGRADNLNQPNNDSFLGAIDELSVYNRALSAAEIQSIYAAGTAGKSLVAPSTSPFLGITSSGAGLTIAWPVSSGYVLQQNVDLTNPAGWVNSTFTVNTSNGTNSIAITPPLIGNLFFRLANP